MTVRSREIVRACFVAVACAACCLVSAGSDPPDSELNPVSGKIETIDTSTDAGNHDVRFVSDPGDGYTRATFMVTADPLDDLGPRLSVTNGGDTWVVWWRDGEIDVTVPDLIIVYNEDTQEPNLNPYFNKGMQVSVIGLPAPEEWRTPRGLETFGPPYIGYDIEYIPIESKYPEMRGNK